MLVYQSHSGFDAEYKKVKKVIRNLDDGFLRLKRLLGIQFDTKNPIMVVGPGKIHHITEIDGCHIWKVEMEVPKSGLRQNQLPRVWFAVRGDSVTFLTIGSHIQNYDNNAKDKMAEERIREL